MAFKKKNISTNELKGSIDSIEAGFINGWVARLGSDEVIEVAVYQGGKFLGSGLANIFREDLALDQIGEGGGHHAFSFPLLEDSIISLKKPIVLKEAKDNLPIKHSAFVFNGPKQNFWISFFDTNENQIRCVIASNQKLGPQKVQVFSGTSLINEIEIKTDEQNVSVSIDLPLSFVDGQDHLLRIGLVNHPFVVGTCIFNKQPIQTPWQYLQESAQSPSVMSLSMQSKFRYESLQLQLESLVEEKASQTPISFSRANSVLIESHENRKNFTALQLPKVKHPEVTIIIPAYNKFELTYHCIASIVLSFNKTSYEVILADDCSDDMTTQAESLIENLVVSRCEENVGFLRNCNRAAELARGNFIIFLNNDTEVTSFWLDALIDPFYIDDDLGMTGAKLINPDGSLQEAGGIVWGNGQPWNVGRGDHQFSPEYNYMRQVDYVTGAAMCIKREIWMQVGGFSNEFIPCYYEDTDLAFKVRQAGFKVVYCPHSVVVHFEGQSHGTDINKGMKKYQAVNEKTFRGKWFKDFKSNGQASLEAMQLEKDKGIDQRVLVIDYATPMPNKDAGSYAALQEIKLIQSLGFKVTFVPENMAFFGKYSLELQKIGVEVIYSPFYSSVNQVLERRLSEMNAVYITRYSVAEKYLGMIRDLNPSAKVIFNNADLHFLREIRSTLLHNDSKGDLSSALFTRDAELRVCREADAVLCYNKTEHAVITSHILETDKLHITPWVLEEKNHAPAFEERNGIAFLGGFRHKPNIEAVEYLVSDIMPVLKKVRPDIVLSIYGSNMPESFDDIQSGNIKVEGFADTLDTVFHKHRVFVSPLLSGAGIKGKVLESMAYGTPCVLTDVAAEGTGLSHGISALIAETPQDWVKRIIQLYDDRELWQIFSDNLSILVKENYSFERGSVEMKKIFTSVGLYSSFN